MEQRISNRELQEWRLYLAVEPFGELRDDYRSASIACIIANANRDPEKSDVFEVSDFLLKFDAEDPEDKQAALEEKLRIWAITAGGVKSEQ